MWITEFSNVFVARFVWKYHSALATRSTCEATFCTIINIKTSIFWQVNQMEVRPVCASVKIVNKPQNYKTKEMTYAPSEDSDQIWRMSRLILAGHLGLEFAYVVHRCGWYLVKSESACCLMLFDLTLHLSTTIPTDLCTKHWHRSIPGYLASLFSLRSAFFAKLACKTQRQWRLFSLLVLSCSG